MGTIMAVVAVLLIHMDRKAVTNMKPRSNLQANRQALRHSGFLPDMGCPYVSPSLDPTQTHRAGRTPMVRSTRRAMRLCSFQCSTDTATIIPPMNNMLVSLKYSMPTWGVRMDLRLWCLLPILLGTGHDILTNWYSSGTSEPNGNGLWAISCSTGARFLPNSLLFF